MYKPVGWEDVARSPGRRRSAEKPARDVPAAETVTRESSEAKESTEQEAGVNAVRLLSDFLSQPANRICAECRTHLADTSKIYASFSTNISSGFDDDGKIQQRGSPVGTSADMDRNGRARDASLAFKGNHELFAPPNEISDTSKSDLTLSRSTEHLRPPHGVFICQDCSLAHIKMLDQSLGYVIKPIQSGNTWSQTEIDILLCSGGNAVNRRIYEAHVPASWEGRRPKRSSTMEQREAWVLAKYAVMGFLFPGGPLHTEEGGGRYVRNGNVGDHLSASVHSNAGTILPNRLLDYFCVVSSSGRLEAASRANLSATTQPSQLRFEPTVMDRYPETAYGEPVGISGNGDLPAHLATFVFPEGLRPRPKHLVPKMFSFVLTEDTGTRVYGAALHIYDESMPIHAFADAISDELEEGQELPAWLRGGGGEGSVDCVYFPKCLVMLSHYPFHDLFRTLLKHIYLISLSEAPLPLERFIQNIISECPLPPQGKIEVRYHLTGDTALTISRPPPNVLPMARMGFRGLFSALSTGNIMAIIGILLQEGRIALCSKSYALLTPVSEALISLLFPFVYQGIYIPVLPYNLLDVLDAPVPFLVGLNSKYLRTTPPQNRPHGVVFVDLDEDVVHLGFDEDSDDFGRPTPRLPKKSASKLKSALDEAGAGAYLPPPCGIKGQMTFGHGQQMPNESREAYAKEEGVVATHKRAAFFDQIDCAFTDKHYREGVDSFVTEAGTISSNSKGAASSPRTSKRWKMKGRTSTNKSSPTRASETIASGNNEMDAHVLEMNEESTNFSVAGIREAFLRFFVSIMKSYEKFIDADGEEFHQDAFINDFDDDEQPFFSQLVKSQMFERFIEERLVNPAVNAHLDLSYLTLRFFDESIIQKKNRSKTTKLVKGSRETPFLLDDSYSIAETFTPPAPSNWGLSGEARFHYVSFPRLQAENYGTIREAKQWEQISKQRKGATSTVLGQQRRIVSGALAASTVEPTLSSKVYDLDWALSYLASVSADGSHTDERNKAQQLVRSSGSRQVRAISAIVAIQRLFRRRQLMRKLEFEKPVSAEIRVAVKETKMTFLMAAILCQRVFRGYKARKLADARIDACSRLKHWWRGVVIRGNYKRLRKASILAQAMFRGRRVRFVYKLTMKALAGIQALGRGWITRRHVARLRRTRIHFYRLQLFELWRHARVSLAYRSNFWTLVHGEGFLHFSLIERELCRCWDLLNVDFSPLADEKLPSTATSRYHRFLLVEDLLEELRPKKDRIQHYHAKLVPVFPAEKVGIQGHVSTASDRQKAQVLHQASEYLTLERLRIYERLSEVKDKAALAKLFEALSLPLDGKLRKKGFAEEIWTWCGLADKSAQLIFYLFPEARETSSIRSSKSPSRKAKKRFAELSSYHEPVSATNEGRFVQRLIDDLTRADLRDVSIALMSAVQQMWHKLEADNNEDDITPPSGYWFERQRDAIAAGHRLSWNKLQYALMRGYLYEESLAVSLYRSGL